MRTVIFGKIIEKHYSVDSKLKQVKDENGEIKKVFINIPDIVKDEKCVDWREICSFEGEPRYNRKNSIFSWLSYDEFNISEDETVKAESEIFRADLSEVHVRTNKIIDTMEFGKFESEVEHMKLMRRFNEQMILSNDKLKAYCDLHKLIYENTDCIELFKLVFPNEKYEIVDGTMRVKKSKIAIRDDRTMGIAYEKAYATICEGTYSHCESTPTICESTPSYAGSISAR